MKIIWLGCLLASCCCMALTVAAEDKIMTSQLPGKWYPADPSALRKDIDGYMKQARSQLDGKVIGLILPHAGYRYSGPVAGYGISEIAGKKYSRVIILAPSHYGLPADIVSVASYTHIQTPLGKVPVDMEAVAKLRASPVVQDYSKIHKVEHSDQIELPMLQVALKDFKVVPILFGPLSTDAVVSVSNAVRSIINENTLVVVSSDFTHYGSSYHYLPFPCNAKTEEALGKLDNTAFSLIANKDLTGFSDFIDRTGDTICGQDAIRVLLAILPANAKVKLLKYDTSGRAAGNFAASVSYASFGITGAWGKEQAVDDPDVGKLDDQERQQLVLLARKTLEWYFQKDDYPEPKDLGIKLTPNMKLDRAVFVTLHKGGELRGCIGEIYPSRPLYTAVMRRVIDSAINDYRFPRVTKDELNSIDIEISVLTPPRPVVKWTDIVLGRDGIIMEKGTRRAVFLPQVATEQKWDLETTLNNLALKAGLSADEWRSKTGFMVFQADVFGEKSLNKKAAPAKP